MKTKNVVMLLGVLIVLAIVFASCMYRPAASQTPALSATPEPDVEEEPAAVVEKMLVEEPKVSDIEIKKFSDLGQFFFDADPSVNNFKVQGAKMTYTCTTGFGVYISMDPAVINDFSTGDLGAVAYVECPKGSTVTLQTPHWSESAKHNQIHMVEFTQEITAEKAVEILKVLKIDEGKELAVFIDTKGVTTKY